MGNDFSLPLAAMRLLFRNILKKYLTCRECYTLRSLIHEQAFRNKTLTTIQNGNPLRKLGTHSEAMVVQS